MRTVTVSIARTVEDCWNAFVDHTAWLRWVPGLRSAELVEFDLGALPREVRFLFGSGLEYSLLYSYEPANRLVHWEPAGGEGRRTGVTGYASFRAGEDGTTELEYAIDHEPDRKAAERALDNPQQVAEAFARYMHEDRP